MMMRLASTDNQTVRLRKANTVDGLTAFSLIEVMIAATITTIIFSAVYFGLMTGFMMVKSSREQLRANQVCLSRMEGVRLCNWDTQLFSNNIVSPTFTEYYYPVGLGSQSNSVIYYGTMQFSNVTMNPTPSYAANVRLLTVTVTWTNIGNGSINVHVEKMSSYVARYGVQTYVYTH
jgi:type II secretory pathway pseudopilin PulG